MKRLLAYVLTIALAAIVLAPSASAANRASDGVRQASKQFYAALNLVLNGNARPMADIWSHRAPATTMHPIGGRQIGWDQVRGSWEKVAEAAMHGKVELKDQLIQVSGDMAYEVGVEHVQSTRSGHDVEAELRVTNIYRREGGAWKIVHHHADISPALVEMLGKSPTPYESTEWGGS